MTFYFLLTAVDTVNQTVQQAAEQAKSAGQKGTVMFLLISKCHECEIPDRAPSAALFLDLHLMGKGKLL